MNACIDKCVHVYMRAIMYACIYTQYIYIYNARISFYVYM